jgi:hypothetical protein
MTRPPDPERLYEARRTAIRNRLLDELRMPTDAVDVWIAAWEIEASGRGLHRLTGAYWDGAVDWIVERRRRPGRPGPR